MKNIYISYMLNQWPRDLNTDFTLGSCLFVPVKLTENANPNKYVYTDYNTEFGMRSEFLLSDSNTGKNVIILGADVSSSVHINNKGKDILILGKRPMQGLDETTITAEAKYLINFTQLQKRFVLSLHYNGSISSLFVNSTKICQSKAKGSEIKIIHYI